MVSRMAMASSIPMSKPNVVYPPVLNLTTPGMRTKSTLARKSKLPMIGEPERISTESPWRWSTKEWAIARQRRKWPSPKESWLYMSSLVFSVVWDIPNPPCFYFCHFSSVTTKVPPILNHELSFHEIAFLIYMHDPSTTIFNIQIEPALFKYTWSYSKYQQLTLVLITFISFPFIFYSLNLPKTIINKAIASKDFPKELFGYNLEQIEYLLILCIVF